MTLSIVSPELEVLTLSVQAEVIGLDNSHACTSLAKLDLNRLLNLACHHGVIRQVFAYCQFHELLNEDEHAMFRQATMFMAVNATSLEQQLLKLTSLFDESSIAYALMKGPAIQRLFGDSQSKECFRNSVDIDLLVKPEDIPKAVAVIESLGYISQEKEPMSVAEFTVKNSGLMKFRDIGFHGKNEVMADIDLHWKLAHTFSLPMLTSEVIGRATDIQVNHQRVKTLSFNNHFLLVCIHGYLDQFFVLKYLVDVYWAINHQDFDLDKILSHARHYGVEEQVKDSIATANVFFNSKQSDKKENQNSYSKKVRSRYVNSKDTPTRMYSTDRSWSVRDKVSYALYQVKTRSKNVFWWKPLLHHFKYDSAMIDKKPRGISAILWLPLAWILKRL